MPDETIRSVVQMEGETQGAEDALARIEALLKKIEQTGARTEAAWRSVIQTMGEGGAIRIVGMDELLRGIQGIQSAMSAGIGVSRQYAEGLGGVETRAQSTAQAQDAAASATRRATAAQAAAVTQQSQMLMAAYRWGQMQQAQQRRAQAQQRRALPGGQRLLPGTTVGPMPAGWSITGGPGGPAGGAGGAGRGAGGGFLGGIGRLFGGMGGTFATHLRWMARYIILWKGMQAVQSGIREWIRVNAELDRSLTLLSTSLGSNVGRLREYREAMFEAAAAGRALPTEVAPAAVMTGRIFDPEEAGAVMTRAAELAFVSGSKVEDVTGTLIVMQRQLGISSEEMASVMDALAGSLRNTHLTYADLVPMLERAVTFSRRYNMSIEETIGLQAGVASATGATGGQLDAMMRRLQDVYVEGSRAWEALDGLGIATVRVGESGEDIRTPMIAIWQEIAKAVEGDQAALEGVSDTLFRTGSIGRAVFEATIANQDLVTQGYYDATQAAGEWQKTMDAMGQTQEAAVRGIKGAWEELLASIGVSDYLVQDINEVTQGMGILAEGIRRVKEWFDRTEASTNAWFVTLGRLAGLPEWMIRLGGGRAPGGEWRSEDTTGRRGVVGEPVTYPQLPPGGVGGPQLPARLDVRTTTLEVPEGANFDDVIRSYDEIVKRWEGTFQDQSGKTYRITQQQITDASKLAMIWDETGNEFRLFRAFLPALQEAIQENTAALKAPGLRFTQFDPVRWAGPVQRLTGYYERVARNLGWNEDPQEQVLWGPEDSILQLSASNIALQLVMHSLTEAVDKNTEALNEGMWNIPEGVTALVPITSLFYQNLNKPGGDPWASANIEEIVSQIMGRGATIAGGAGTAGTMGGAGAPWGGYQYRIPGVSPYSMAEASSDLTRSASALTSSAYALQTAASLLGRDPYPVPYLPPIMGAAGAVVTRPTMAMIGDRGPEAVVPLNQTPGATPLSAGQPVMVHLTMMMDKRILAEVTRETMAEVY